MHITDQWIRETLAKKLGIPVAPATKWTDDHGRQHVTAAQPTRGNRA